MRNIMIRKKLAERKRFDSADYAMQQQVSATTTNHDSTIGATRPVNLHITTNPVILQRASNTPVEHVQSPVVQIGMAAFFDSMSEDTCSATAPNSPSVDSMTLSPANRQTTVSSSDTTVAKAQQQAKYGALSARNIILRRKLAHGSRFDSADYQLQQNGQGKLDGIPTEDLLPLPQNDKDIEATGAADIPMSVEPHTAASTQVSTGPTNYGKLCAQHILIRKKLKERKRFDSADYSMEHSKGVSASSTSAAVAAQVARSMAADQHQAKLLKISVESPKPIKDASGNCSSRDLSSPTSRVVSRNVFIQRKLQERKRFDSADYFQEKQRQQQQHP
ncbi:hypothetical protein DYB32_001743 [Aphanomyces invadans]|uniref:Uncharacterized protein n=1 Tax=Aphanomyces invadans TaxID=157072 RepID=A0A418B595_9STRA|nr:hypothetical protein DYB32_001743 [Aphanomyces invadans]